MRGLHMGWEIDKILVTEMKVLTESLGFLMNFPRWRSVASTETDNSE